MFNTELLFYERHYRNYFFQPVRMSSIWCFVFLNDGRGYIYSNYAKARSNGELRKSIYCTLALLQYNNYYHMKCLDRIMCGIGAVKKRQAHPVHPIIQLCMKSSYRLVINRCQSTQPLCIVAGVGLLNKDCTFI